MTGPKNPRLAATVAAVALLGFGVTALSVVDLWRHPTSPYGWLFAVAVVVVGRFRLEVPGHPATVSVSEVFIFALVLLFGSAPATVTLAVDGLLTSLLQKHRRLDRMLFNTAEPALSVWASAQAFFAVAGIPPMATAPADTTHLLVPLAAMVGVYFACDSILTATVVALEQRGSMLGVWRQHALYLGLMYAAGGALAALGVNNTAGFRLEVIALALPVLLLSYVTYRTASQRIADAERHVRAVDERYLATIESLAMAVDEKDDVTHGHVRRVQRYSRAVAQALGLRDPELLKALDAAALLHDVGKVSVADDVLNKPGRLTRREFEAMKGHVLSGVRILERVRFPYPVVPIVRAHHERWDGSGYPDGLAGEAIPFGARILTVVDCFDALTSDRPYRGRLSDDTALKMIEEGRGSHFDPRVVDQFVALVPELRRGDGPLAATPRPEEPQMAPLVDDGNPAVHPEWRELRQNAGRVLAAVGRLLPTAQGVVFGVDSESGRLSAIALGPALEPCARGDAMPRFALSTWVAAHRFTIASSDAALDLEFAASALTLRGVTAIPVFVCGSVVGVLSVYRPDATPVSQAVLLSLGQLAQELAAAADQPAGDRCAARG